VHIAWVGDRIAVGLAGSVLTQALFPGHEVAHNFRWGENEMRD